MTDPSRRKLWAEKSCFTADPSRAVASYTALSGPNGSSPMAVAVSARLRPHSWPACGGSSRGRWRAHLPDPWRLAADGHSGPFVQAAKGVLARRHHVQTGCLHGASLDPLASPTTCRVAHHNESCHRRNMPTMLDGPCATCPCQMWTAMSSSPTTSGTPLRVSRLPPRAACAGRMAPTPLRRRVEDEATGATSQGFYRGA